MKSAWEKTVLASLGFLENWDTKRPDLPWHIKSSAPSHLNSKINLRVWNPQLNVGHTMCGQGGQHPQNTTLN